MQITLAACYLLFKAKKYTNMCDTLKHLKIRFVLLIIQLIGSSVSALIDRARGTSYV